MNNIQTLAVAILPLVFAITLHEAAHGWVANRLGDPTARYQGRLTFNPIPHIDPVGTILVPILMFVMSGFIFGWAKPVPVDVRNFAHPRKDMAIVAAAGPISNLLMAAAWVLVAKFAVMLPQSLAWFVVPLILMAKIGLLFNIILMVFNFLPIPPLDGSRVLAWLLPPSLAAYLDKAEPYGFFVLLGLLFVGFYPLVIGPLTRFFSGLLTQVFSVPL
ncbi:MAG: site-2 protease family protein [bacterium]